MCVHKHTGQHNTHAPPVCHTRPFVTLGTPREMRVPIFCPPKGPGVAARIPDVPARFVFTTSPGQGGENKTSRFFPKPSRFLPPLRPDFRTDFLSRFFCDKSRVGRRKKHVTGFRATFCGATGCLPGEAGGGGWWEGRLVGETGGEAAGGGCWGGCWEAKCARKNGQDRNSGLFRHDAFKRQSHSRFDKEHEGSGGGQRWNMDPAARASDGTWIPFGGGAPVQCKRGPRRRLSGAMASVWGRFDIPLLII